MSISFPPPSPDLERVRRLVARAFPRRRVLSFDLLSGGHCNTNLKIVFDSSHAPAVLRIFERDPSACAKETALLRLVRKTVSVPEVFYAEYDPESDVAPFALLEYMEGPTFTELKRANNIEGIQQASASAGQTLAAIGRYQFAEPGMLALDTQTDNLEVAGAYIEGPDPIPRLLDVFLASPNLRQRASAALIDQLHEFIWAWAPRLAQLDETPERGRSLVHSDFYGGNILFKQLHGRWVVRGVLDWEFAFSGTQLIDVGHFLRLERAMEPLREPYFSRAFVEQGGWLPPDWRRIATVLDLTALCEMLTRDELPSYAAVEILCMIQETLLM
jgi:aminoglycoside phosphotransferase (APT) family kinase protein